MNPVSCRSLSLTDWATPIRQHAMTNARAENWTHAADLT
jgi:hypothetical protein